MLLTILGEFVYPEGKPVWTSTLIHVLKGVGIEEKAARQAISRGAEAGWISSERRGREVRWHLTPTGTQLIEEGAERVMSLGANSHPWDGSWLILVVTIPNGRRTARRRLYRSLEWVGFGNPTPGLWVSAHPERQGEVGRIIDDLKLSDSTFSFVGSSTGIGLSDHELVDRAWNLDSIAEYYEELLKNYEGLRLEDEDSILFAQVRLVNDWQRLPFIDPQLPDSLLPPDWIGRRAAAFFQERRAAWHEAAHDRWHELNER
ncbi:PaaX family transcriptional regulator [Rubrobacter xylanophilus]|uniref:PaaX family transcriptional regulator n=1 Tax=Rubrobacter xylanophilus TaxID=49319 RepID=A0A510HL13_9ACTN|nr:PaaX family transcriptional regulator C-terminal domain-containing protein [Rubrobacter xylanophilus]BBL79283.1 PaaX family transcriptional regulator [Rubrobacter xylanophilus]